MAKQTTSDSPAARVAELREKINHYNHMYYVEAISEISDLEFDRLMKELEHLEAQHPELRSSDSPTQHVGGKPVDVIKAVKHIDPMFSIGNALDAPSLRSFDERIRKLVAGQPIRYTIEPKIDGAAINLTYRDGVLERGATRGDGDAGDDITHNIKTVGGVPLRLRTDNPPALIEVRGEVYMTKADFAKINERNRESGAKTYANPRNLTSGSIRMLDPREVATRKLRFFGYSVGACDGIALRSHVEMLKKLKEFGFPVPEVQSFDTIEEVIPYCEGWEPKKPGEPSKRFSLPYDIDGLVIKLDNLDQRKKLGATAKDVRWAIAYKFKAEEGITKVLEVVIHVGKKGEQTPVLTLAPIQLSGSVVQHASMTNAAQMKDRDVRIGDSVVVVKRGEIIPYIERVLTEARTGKEQPYVFPAKCPECGHPTKLNESGNLYFCTGDEFCPAQVSKRIEKYGVRTRMEIEGLGEKMADALVDAGLVKRVTDLYKLTEKQLLTLEGVAGKSAQNLLAGIEASKSRGLARLLSALAIYGMAESMAANLAKAYPSIDLLLAASKEELTRVEGFGPTRAASVYNFFHSTVGEEMVAEFRAAGVKLTEDVPVHSGPAVLAGKTIVVTGALINYDRVKIEARITELGGKAAGSVSKNTSFVLAGTGKSTRSKLATAETLGIKVISEEEFEQMVKDLSGGAGPAAAPTQVSVAASAPAKAPSEPLAGKTIVVAGTLLKYNTKKDAEAVIEQMGGKVGTTVSKNTSFLVAGDDAGVKLDKARELGVQVVTEQEFEKMIGKA